MTEPAGTGGDDASGGGRPAGAPEEEAGPGTIGLWFWGTLLAFGVFLVLVPGHDPRARFWLVAGVVLAVASVAGLALVLRRRQ